MLVTPEVDHFNRLHALTGAALPDEINLADW
jgi:hypothetical protein